MTTYAISGMTCGGCARKVESALQAVAASASVTLDPPRATVPGSNLEQMNAALAAIGSYRASPVTQTFVLPGFVKTYYPLFLVLGLVAVAALAGDSWMMSFMAGFFIVFGAFKLLDVPAFAASYARYDIIAKRLPVWGYLYPFVELGLGFAFLFWYQMQASTWLALGLSLVGAIGVIQSVQRKETIQCACLGTVFKLPMSTVTIVENLGMAVMAGWMLVFGM